MLRLSSLTIALCCSTRIATHHRCLLTHPRATTHHHLRVCGTRRYISLPSLLPSLLSLHTCCRVSPYRLPHALLHATTLLLLATHLLSYVTVSHAPHVATCHHPAACCYTHAACHRYTTGRSPHVATSHRLLVCCTFASACHHPIACCCVHATYHPPVTRCYTPAATSHRLLDHRLLQRASYCLHPIEPVATHLLRDLTVFSPIVCCNMRPVACVLSYGF